MEKTFTIFLILSLICYYVFIGIDKKENFNMDKIYYNPPIKSNKIIFDYDNKRAIEDVYQIEQKKGANLATWYPNTWIEKIDENGKPIYNSRDKVTKNIENFVESKARFTYEFNQPKILQMDGVVDILDNVDPQGRTIKEVYDNAFVDYKKLVPKMKKITSEERSIGVQGASGLSFIGPETMEYENETILNGGPWKDDVFPTRDETRIVSSGAFEDNIYPNDPSIKNPNSIF